MKIIARLLAPILAAFLLIWTASVFAEYTRSRPITANNAEQLTVTLAHGGYTGPLNIDEMTLCTPQGNATLYLGSESNVNATNGYALEAGSCQHYKSGGSFLAAGACSSGTVSITGATTSMSAVASPAGGADPSNGGILGVAIDARVSSSNTVTVSVCSPVAGTPAAANYNVRVIP